MATTDDPNRPDPEDPDRQGPDPEPRPSVFVHDFAPLDLEFRLAGSALLQLLGTEQLAFSVAGACNREGQTTRGFAVDARTLHPYEVTVNLGAARWREDAVVIPIEWLPEPVDAGVPLEADLEVASYGDQRCHLHLLGRSRLRSGVRPATREASLYGRLAVAVVRHVLNDLAVAITSQVAGPLVPPAATRFGLDP